MTFHHLGQLHRLGLGVKLKDPGEMAAKLIGASLKLADRNLQRACEFVGFFEGEKLIKMMLCQSVLAMRPSMRSTLLSPDRSILSHRGRYITLKFRGGECAGGFLFTPSDNNLVSYDG
jgi:hypothetical protein